MATREHTERKGYLPRNTQNTRNGDRERLCPLNAQNTQKRNTMDWLRKGSKGLVRWAVILTQSRKDAEAQRGDADGILT